MITNNEVQLAQEVVVMPGTVRVMVPQLLKERGLTATDLMYGARLAPGTAYKLASEEDCNNLTGISFDVLVRVCYFLDVDVSDVIQISEREDPPSG